MALFSRMLAALMFLQGFWTSVATDHSIAKHTCASDSVKSCNSVDEEGEHRARNLLQISQEHRVVRAHEHKHAPNQERVVGLSIYNGSSAESSERPITFITVYDPFFEVNLGTSFLWMDRKKHPHQWILIDNNHNFGISQMYAEAQARAAHDLMVFLHPDTILPREFYDGFMHKLWIIQQYDPNWGVLGAVGVPYGKFISNSSITDFAQTYKNGDDFLPVQGIDECLMVLDRRSPLFDRDLPGFDLYGLDIVLSARKAGQMSYLLNVPLFHKLKGLDGKNYTVESFSGKVDSPQYTARVDKTAKYFQKKWCSSGYLPVRGPSFQLECNHWCKVIDMLNRSHHNETCVDPTGEYMNWH